MDHSHRTLRIVKEKGTCTRPAVTGCVHIWDGGSPMAQGGAG